MLFLVKAVICSYLVIVLLFSYCMCGVALWVKTILVGSLLFESCAFEHVCPVATKLNQTFFSILDLRWNEETR
jgi:hypothetical protein